MIVTEMRNAGSGQVEYLDRLAQEDVYYDNDPVED